MSTARFTWQSALMRATIGTAGGFAAALLFMAGGAAALIGAGAMARADAVVLTGMLAFLVWMAALLVAFGAASARRAAAWVLGGAAGFALLGWACLHLTPAA